MRAPSSRGRRTETRLSLRSAPRWRRSTCSRRKKQRGEPFDLVFIDADKRGYRAYYDLLLTSGLLRPGALLLADNVLFKGKVLNSEQRATGKAGGKELNHWQKRHQEIADDLHAFNAHVNKDPRNEALLPPLRDGLTLIRRL